MGDTQLGESESEEIHSVSQGYKALVKSLSETVNAALNLTLLETSSAKC